MNYAQFHDMIKRFFTKSRNLLPNFETIRYYNLNNLDKLAGNLMTKTNKSSNTSNFFGKLRKKLTHSHEKNSNAPESLNSLGTGVLPEPPLNPYYSRDITNVLFLSKRGMSRAPLAREVMRKYFIYLNSLAVFALQQGGFLMHMNFVLLTSGWCRVQKSSDMNFRECTQSEYGELSSANLIISLDQESEQYIKSRKFYIRGQVRPIGMFLPAGNSPYMLTLLREMN